MDNHGLRRFKLGWNTSEQVLHYYRFDFHFDEGREIIGRSATSPDVHNISSGHCRSRSASGRQAGLQAYGIAHGQGIVCLLRHQADPAQEGADHVCAGRLFDGSRDSVADIWPIDHGASAPPQGWPGWPDGKRFALVLTHDVDTGKGQERCLDLARLEMELGFAHPSSSFRNGIRFPSPCARNWC
jgi:hypothetical protein